MSNDPLVRFQKIAEIAGEGVASVTDVAKALHAVTAAFADHVKPLFKRLNAVERDHAAHRLHIHQRVLEVEDNASKSAADLKRQISRIQLTPGPKGEKGDDGVGQPGRDGSPDTPEQIVGKLSSIGEPWLEHTAIKGFDELAKNVQVAQARPIFGVPSRGLFLYIAGVKMGIISNLNIVGGAGVSVAYSLVNRQSTLTINASGGGVTVETPSGTVNGTNTQFTPTAEPKWVVADGTTYYEGSGYTWDGTHINMAVAPSEFIRDII